MSIKVQMQQECSSDPRRGFLKERYITDHPDDPNEPVAFLAELYANLRSSGFSSVRYDWRWSLIEPEQGALNQDQISHYRNVRKIMDSVRLQPPTIILSSPPTWALYMYRSGNVADFLAQYRKYTEVVASSLARKNMAPVRVVQVSNELNNRLYNQIRPQDIVTLCSATRDAFRPYFGEVQLMTTVLALPRRPLVDSALHYLKKHRDILEAEFDVIGVDYYPGVWHWPHVVDLLASLRNVSPEGGRLQGLIVGNTTLLESIYAELSTWQVEYELAEFGWTSYRLLGGERRQYKNYVAFLRSYRSMLIRLSESGVTKCPHRVGVYMARDEAMTGLLRNIIRQQRWGLYDRSLRPKAASKAFFADLTS